MWVQVLGVAEALLCLRAAHGQGALLDRRLEAFDVRAAKQLRRAPVTLHNEEAGLLRVVHHRLGLHSVRHAREVHVDLALAALPDMGLEDVVLAVLHAHGSVEHVEEVRTAHQVRLRGFLVDRLGVCLLLVEHRAACPNSLGPELDGVERRLHGAVLGHYLGQVGPYHSHLAAHLRRDLGVVRRDHAGPVGHRQPVAHALAAFGDRHLLAARVGARRRVDTDVEGH
mmetsp:Transcript_32922/g.76182  ORF Transcript_32922/g.76182 Transcript_32922/m.76182 type:complete len:226 (-) Transcript_32922:689-1366(-)